MANFLKSLFVKGVEIDTAGASTGNVLSYNGTKFAPAAPGSGSLALDDLSDVVVTSPEEFQGLSYNGVSWVNSHIPLVSYVRNAEATTITTGTCVYLYGATGDHASVKRADNTSDTTSSKTIGVAGAGITASNNGPIVTRGYVDGIDLSTGYTAGDILWLGTNGSFTKTKPTSPAHLVFIGVVVRATNNGIIYVATQNGYELDELHNVSAGSPSAGDFLKYNGSLWVNDAIDLGTDTTGSYVASLVAGTGISLANNSGEGATPTITNTGVTSINTTLTGAVTGVVTTSDTGTVTSAMIADGTIVNADVSTSAAIAHSKLANATAGQVLLGTTTTGVVTATTLSGDVTINGAGVTAIGSGVIVNADVNASAAIALSKLASGTAGQVVVANASGVPTYTTISGDITVSSTGVATIAANSVILGTDTTGNYMSDISGTSPVSVSHTPAEGSSATVSLATAYGDTQNPYGSKTANYFLASPDGSASNPSFRAMVNADIPSALTSKTYNGLTVTSTTGTFTLTNTKTLSVTNTLTLSGTDSTTMTFPATSSTVMTLATPGTLTGTLTLRAGTATAGTAPMYLQSGTNLTTAAAGALEFDGTNLYFTPSTSRKTVAFTDSNITGTAANITASSNTSITSLSNLATVGTITSGTWSGSFGAVSGANLTSLNASNLGSGTVPSARISGSYSGITSVGTLSGLAVAGNISSQSVTNGDIIQISPVMAGTTGRALILTNVALTATTRTITFPNADGTVITTGNLTGITAVGTLSSLTVDGISSTSITLGDWSGNGAYSSIGGVSGYLLFGSTGDSNIYLRSNNNNNVYIGANDQNTLHVTSSQTLIATGSATTPTLAIQGDTNTGLYSGLADWLNVTCGGTGMATFTTSGPFFGTNTTTSTVTWRVDTFNRLGTPTSTRELKENIEDLAGEQALSIVRALRPRTFTWKPQPDDGEFLSSLKQGAVQAGFIVEEIEETTLPLSMLEYKPNISDSMTEDEKVEAATNLASYIPYYWKESHLIAILASAVKSLDARLAVLESTQ
jgi:hypothetical protein